MEKVVKKVKKGRLIALIAGIIVIIVGIILLFALNSGKSENKNEEKDNNNESEIKEEENKPKEDEEEPSQEKVDIIDVNSKTRPFAVSTNNTPVAVKVQEGLNNAYLVYEIPTEGSTSRLLALYKDTKGVKTGTIRSARHNFIDFALESDAIFVAYGWSHYAEDDLKKNKAIDYVQGIVSEGGMFRENPEGLATEHTAYANIDTVANYAYDKKKYKKESDNTILLKYNVGDVSLAEKEGAIKANKVTIPYGSVTTVFEYNEETKMYTRVVNSKVALDHATKEPFTTKNIIVERLTYNVTDDKYYWNLHTTGSGEGYFITNGYAVPIKWSKKDRKSKTVYTYLNGEEIEVSDGRTYIEVQVTSKKTTIE